HAQVHAAQRVHFVAAAAVDLVQVLRTDHARHCRLHQNPPGIRGPPCCPCDWNGFAADSAFVPDVTPVITRMPSCTRAPRTSVFWPSLLPVSTLAACGRPASSRYQIIAVFAGAGAPRAAAGAPAPPGA